MIARRQDRREGSRADVLGDLFLSISDEKSRFRGDAMNISANGINFLSLTRLAMFHEVDVHLQLPGCHDGVKIKIHCHGIVVRCEHRVTPFFEISLYFMDLSGADKHRIQKYIARLPLDAPLGPK